MWGYVLIYSFHYVEFLRFENLRIIRGDTRMTQSSEVRFSENTVDERGYALYVAVNNNNNHNGFQYRHFRMSAISACAEDKKIHKFLTFWFRILPFRD